MKQLLQATHAEFIKNKNSTIVWVSFIAFALAPVMGGVFLLIVQDPEALAKAGGLADKVKAMDFQPDWRSYLSLLTQAVGVGGILVFGFVASWVFGREYSDKTAKDMLSLPTARTKILNAKFIVYVTWCMALVISNLLVGLLIGSFIHLSPIDREFADLNLTDYLVTTALTIIVVVPVSFFATWGRGYLAPLGFIALSAVVAQVIAAIGYGTYFPWSIPGLYSGAGGEYKKFLNNLSYAIIILTGIAGYISTVLYFARADQTK